LTIKETGELYWNDEPITEATMQAQLRVAAQRTPQPELQIRADKGTEYQVISTIMGDAKNAGMVKLGFITQAHGTEKK
jgi:biopolymer transport protein ExbD